MAFRTIGVEESGASVTTLRSAVAANDSALALGNSPAQAIPGSSGLLKRGLDVFFSLAFLVLVGSWLMPLLALAIRLDSPGPALYRQVRVGYRGRNFVCLKFRSMADGPSTEFVQATPDDPRLTRVGRWLRRTNLDEIPQFLNVLKGEMSIVGPRPHVPELVSRFAAHVPGYDLRHQVRPGMTGLAQVRGLRGETRNVREMRHRVRMDRLYISACGPLLDLKIAIWTVGCLIKGDENAY